MVEMTQDSGVSNCRSKKSVLKKDRLEFVVESTSIQQTRGVSSFRRTPEAGNPRYTGAAAQAFEVW